MPPLLAMMADTLLVRPVDVPTPWYSVASGVLSIVVTLLLLGIAVALLGMARALKGAERNLGGRLQGLADELIPLARNLNQIATQLSEVTAEARSDLKKLSGTVVAVDDAVRDAIEAGESRLHQFGTMLDAVQDEAQATVASATGIMRGVRTGAGSLVSNLFRGSSSRRPPASRGGRQRADVEAPPRNDADVLARLAALEAAFAETDDDESADDIEPPVARAARDAAPHDRRADAWNDEDDDENDEDLEGDDLTDADDDDAEFSDEDADDTDDDDDDDDDEYEDEDEDDEDDDDDEDDEDDDEAHDEVHDEDGVIPGERRARDVDAEPRAGGPRIRPRGRA